MQLVLLCLLFSVSYSKVYFDEESYEDFENRWVYSSDTSVTHGKFSRVKRTHDNEENYCIKSMNDSSYYHMSSKFSAPLDTAAQDLHLMYVVKYEAGMDCGGGYLKLFSELDQKSFNGNSPYAIMFGLDKCGYETQKIHFIVSHKGTNYQTKSKIAVSVDSMPHLLELFVSTSGKFVVRMDGSERLSGELEEHFEYMPPKKIDDPNDKKPEDWVDEDTIDDPSDRKPDTWDDRPNIVDTEAKKPADWDDATDGEWEPDLMPNPLYKGEWAPKRIPNPKFKGVWEPKKIDNPEYKPDTTFAKFPLRYVGFDLWTVKSGTTFDSIYITDNSDEASARAKVLLDQVTQETEKLKKEEEEARKNAKPPTDLDDKDGEAEPAGEEEGDLDQDDHHGHDHAHDHHDDEKHEDL